jgi:hypothetical protein
MAQHRRSAYWAVVLSAFALPNIARAAEMPPGTASWYESPLSMMDVAAKAAGSAAGSAWAGVSGLFSGSEPYDYMPSQLNEDDRRFFATLDALGLQLSEIKVGGGILSHSSYRFVAARDPSDVDIQRAERKLAEFRATSGGLRNGAKQRIARAILDVAGDNGFVLTAVVIELWPWPSVQYEISARNRPPEAAERRVIDATQQ